MVLLRNSNEHWDNEMNAIILVIRGEIWATISHYQRLDSIQKDGATLYQTDH